MDWVVPRAVLRSSTALSASGLAISIQHRPNYYYHYVVVVVLRIGFSYFATQSSFIFQRLYNTRPKALCCGNSVDP